MKKLSVLALCTALALSASATSALAAGNAPAAVGVPVLPIGQQGCLQVVAPPPPGVQPEKQLVVLTAQVPGGLAVSSRLLQRLAAERDGRPRPEAACGNVRTSAGETAGAAERFNGPSPRGGCANPGKDVQQ